MRSQSHGQILLAKSYIENISWLFKNREIIACVLMEKVRGNLGRICLSEYLDLCYLQFCQKPFF